jgi:sterol desaturase/sphingolipid hydroxylase (fatty acid hydroxylase superfamily)
MKLVFYKNKDFWSGMMLVGIGATAMFIARDYKFGSTLRMGPGYFPIVLSGILILFGIYIMTRGLFRKQKFTTSWPFRPMILLSVSIVMFGVLMKAAGLIPAMVALIFGSAFAGTQFKLVEVSLLALVLVGFGVAVFVFAFGLPLPLIQGFE